MTRSYLRSAVLAAAVSLVSAQGITLSQQCQSTLLTAAGSPQAACLNIGGLAGLLTTPANQTIVPPLTLWLEGFCSQAPCTNDDLSAIATNITAGCSTDLAPLGLTGSSTSDIITTIETLYPTYREILCLKETSNNTLCATSLLDEIQAVTGTLSVSSLIGEISGLSPLNASSGLPQYIECSDCTKQAFNILKQEQPSLVTSDVTNAVQSQCGSSFVDGTTPSGIVEGTGTAAPSGTDVTTTKNAAVIIYPGAIFGITGSLLMTVFSAFVVLA